MQRTLSAIFPNIQNPSFLRNESDVSANPRRYSDHDYGSQRAKNFLLSQAKPRMQKKKAARKSAEHDAQSNIPFTDQRRRQPFHAIELQQSLQSAR
mmetsp:Transcript_44398/g.172554  ORF Transcript_44398/g.172554 Transcript_44398/m.172554 type:complete len:96 (-) Transcript_44398:103-390(-)